MSKFRKMMAMAVAVLVTGCSAVKPAATPVATPEPAATPAVSATPEASATPVATSQAPSGDVQKITVGTMGTYSPFTFTEANGALTGYDVEVLRLLDTKIPDIQFEFVTAVWDALFLGLDAKKFDLLANQISRTPEREEKYAFMDKGYFFAQTKLVVKSDDTKTNLSEFKGLTMGGATGDVFTTMLEDYNKANGNPFTVKYYGEDYTPIFVDLSAGRIAGTLNDTIVVDDIVKNLGLNVKCVGDVLESSPSFYVMRKDEAGLALKAKLDKAMDECLADGSLVELSKKWFDADYTK